MIAMALAHVCLWLDLDSQPAPSRLWDSRYGIPSHPIPSIHNHRPSMAVPSRPSARLLSVCTLHRWLGYCGCTALYPFLHQVPCLSAVEASQGSAWLSCPLPSIPIIQSVAIRIYLEIPACAQCSLYTLHHTHPRAGAPSPEPAPAPPIMSLLHKAVSNQSIVYIFALENCSQPPRPLAPMLNCLPGNDRENRERRVNTHSVKRTEKVVPIKMRAKTSSNTDARRPKNW